MASWLAEGRAVAEATVVETWGSPPVPVGGRMIIAGEDEFLGSVSGGCVEADVIAAALDVIDDGAPQSIIFGIGDELAWRAGLACGSKIRVHVQPLTGSNAALLANAFASVSHDRMPRVIATRLSDGSRRVYDAMTNPPDDIAAAFANGKSLLVGTGDSEHFLHVIAPPPRIAIVGATHVAQILGDMAKSAGFDVTVIDPRSAFTSSTRFNPATAITGWPEAQITKFAADPATAIVTLTHVGHIDDEALKIAIREKCRYVGALGSRKTHADRVVRLKSAGFSDAEISRIHAPVGLDIGGRSPGEIAVSILAQIVAAFNDKLPQ